MKKAKAEFEGASRKSRPKKQFTYTLDSAIQMEPKLWYAQFFTGDGTRNDSGGAPGRVALEKIFRKHYGAKTDELFNFEMSENTHAGFAKTKKGAEKLLGEIAFVLDSAGFKQVERENEPMKYCKRKPPLPKP